MKRFFLVIAALLAPLAAVAQNQPSQQMPDWRAVAPIGDGDQAMWLLADVGTIQSPTATTREVMIANAFRGPQPLGKSGATYTMMQIRYLVDCRANTRAIRYIIVWMGDRKIHETRSDDPPNIVNAGSPLGRIVAAACSGDYSGLERIKAKGPAEEAARRFAGGN